MVPVQCGNASVNVSSLLHWIGTMLFTTVPLGLSGHSRDRSSLRADSPRASVAGGSSSTAHFLCALAQFARRFLHLFSHIASCFSRFGCGLVCRLRQFVVAPLKSCDGHVERSKTKDGNLFGECSLERGYGPFLRASSRKLLWKKWETSSVLSFSGI